MTRYSDQRESRPTLTILLSGMLAAVPHQGGASWAILQYLLGLRRLGHDVYFVEPLSEAASGAGDAPLEGSASATYFRQVVERFGLGRCSALLREGSEQTVGLEYEELRRVARRADLLINVSGMLTDEELLGPIPTRVYLDLDPVFNQLWHAVQGIDMRFAAHTHFVSVGLALGQPECPVPTLGLPWVTTLQPVVLEHWPTAERIAHDALTTIANWRGYGSIEHDGVLYGQKVHSLRRFIDLPTRTDERFVLALAIHPGEATDLAALAAHNWTLVDPNGVCYLASGRPVIAQDTGFSRFLPTGEGLVAFDTADDVLAGIEALRADYPRHARAARAIAEAHFDSDVILRQFADEAGVAP